MIYITSLLAALIFFSCGAYAQSEAEILRRVETWNRDAPTCLVEGIRHPTKQSDETSHKCDDGDMTLFSGLLCSSGDQRGCDAVRLALDEKTGLWHRSPRIRLLGKNDRGNADSSPDMAMGVQHYLVTTGDIARAKLWFAWMNSNYYCVPFKSLCLTKIPKFCPTDDCVMRPQDAAWLSATVNYLQKFHGMGALQDGPLRAYLGTFSGYGDAISEILANVERTGFPQHVNASAIWLLKKTGAEDYRLAQGAEKLRERNPGNAFFSWLARKPKVAVINETLLRCPSDPSTLVHPLYEWQWERDNHPDPDTHLFAWQQSCIWDCIFMANLIRQMP